MIPIMSDSALYAKAFVSKEENRTLDTFLYAPIGIRNIFFANALGTFIPAMLVAFLPFVCFGTVVNIGGWAYFQKLIFPELRWMILILLVFPAVTLFALTFIIHISPRRSKPSRRRN
jgi:ABC-type Na+ efflux pump permease subunit